jgi:hypothetical protein
MEYTEEKCGIEENLKGMGIGFDFLAQMDWLIMGE